jgi:hypothetical protein
MSIAEPFLRAAPGVPQRLFMHVPVVDRKALLVQESGDGSHAAAELDQALALGNPRFDELVVDHFPAVDVPVVLPVLLRHRRGVVVELGIRGALGAQQIFVVGLSRHR